MKFPPIRAASVFFLALSWPALLATSVISTWPAIAIVMLVVGAAATWGLFFLGAKAARRPHSPKSLIISVLLTWSFTFSIGGMATHFAPNGGPWLDIVMSVVSLAFIFLVGWRLAPPMIAEANG